MPDSALSGPTLSLLQLLQDNYEPSVTVPEEQDAAEVAEQDAFLDAIMSTQVMQLAETFLKNNGECLHWMRLQLKTIESIRIFLKAKAK